jgi:hypothetical protein
LTSASSSGQLGGIADDDSKTNRSWKTGNGCQSVSSGRIDLKTACLADEGGSFQSPSIFFVAAAIDSRGLLHQAYIDRHLAQAAGATRQTH